MDEHSPLFVKFGMSPTAAKVYLCLLREGNGTADSIAKKAGTYKANVYDACERLIEKGLVSCITEKGRRVFFPTNPEKIARLIEEGREKSEEKYRELAREANAMMPNLLGLYKSEKGLESFEVYRGKNALRGLLNEIFAEKPGTWKGFGLLQLLDDFPVDWPKWFRGIKHQFFGAKKPVVVERFKRARKYCNIGVKWLPEDSFMPFAWIVTGDNLLIFIFEKEHVTLRVKSKGISRLFEKQFDSWWKNYPKGK